MEHEIIVGVKDIVKTFAMKKGAFGKHGLVKLLTG